ncbi:MAG: CehA/McbA family metallohydrolase [Armatimonadota bacterium]
MQRLFLPFLAFAAAVLAAPGPAAQVDLQPLAAQARRVVETLDFLGAPLPPADRKAVLEAAEAMAPGGAARIERVLDRHALYHVEINPESRVKVAPGAAKPELVEGGWRTFLVKVRNDAGVTAPLRVTSPNAGRLHNSPQGEVAHRWLDLLQHTAQPLRPELSGLELEYRVLSLYSRDAGKREAKVSFNVGQGTQDLGFRSEVDTLFTALPASTVTLRVRDEHGKPCTAGFVIRDRAGRVYPSPAKRLAPDFSFHPQIYRKDGETVRLPAGEYQVEVTRGPEYHAQRRAMKVPAGKKHTETFKLARWVDPATLGWYSGDHHIHAAGCAHYTNPTEGVHAPDMARHCQGEDLKVGCNLTWGPCFDYQKQFFTGKIDPTSQYPYLLRYDVEVSGFGSHQSGHLCLLRLKEQIYPGGDSTHHWPTLGLNTLRWAKAQGAVTGPAHSGWGLEVETAELPNYVIPPYSGIGANEYVVDVTHEVPGPDGKPVPAVDFMSTVDTPYVWELNMWYHTLNCGFRTRISGETDFPCIYGERVGLGRSYVKLDGKLDFDTWIEGVRQGRSYVSDGQSHLMELRVNQTAVGENGSEVRLAQPGTVRLTVKASALLPEKPNPALSKRPYTQQPYWHLERARAGESREVPVEVIVNGYPVARQMLAADGVTRDLTFDVPVERSSWVAVRVLPSSHTNPVWVLVGGKPVRASRRSAEWCLKGVDRCWSQKERFIKPEEKEEARRAYEHARVTYRRVLGESEVD